MKKVLLLGSTGKMGCAIRNIFADSYDVICKNSKDFDAFQTEQVRSLISETRPDIVINTVAFLGIDPSEAEPEKAFQLNTIYPRLLAELSNEYDFLLVHFSTDAVFNDVKGDSYHESDSPCPINMYGFTKHGGDCFIQDIAKKYYLCRISILFGETEKENQFVEKMLKKVREGTTELKISDDIISSPSYARDIATEIMRIISEELPYGTYHIANEGKASLYDLMCEIKQCLDLNIALKRVSCCEFPSTGKKNTYTPIKSEKVPPMRPWQEAVREYCSRIDNVKKKPDSKETEYHTNCGR